MFFLTVIRGKSPYKCKGRAAGKIRVPSLPPDVWWRPATKSYLFSSHGAIYLSYFVLPVTDSGPTGTFSVVPLSSSPFSTSPSSWLRCKKMRSFFCFFFSRSSSFSRISFPTSRLLHDEDIPPAGSRLASSSEAGADPRCHAGPSAVW